MHEPRSRPKAQLCVPAAAQHTQTHVGNLAASKQNMLGKSITLKHTYHDKRGFHKRKARSASSPQQPFQVHKKPGSLLQRAAEISPKGDTALVRGQERSNVTAARPSRAISSQSEPRPINPCAMQMHRVTTLTREGAACHPLWVHNSPKPPLQCSQHLHLTWLTCKTLWCHQNMSPNQVAVANLRAHRA